MDFKSVQKYAIKSPRKLREVTPLIKNLSPVDAVDRLPFIKNTGSEIIRKVIMAAIAQARQKGVGDKDLKFKELQINEGPRLKRFHAGSRGRAKPYVKRMSHIRVVLTTKPEAKNLQTTAKKEEKLGTKFKKAIVGRQKAKSK
jgi:large subunit ribosomal protein L22